MSVTRIIFGCGYLGLRVGKRWRQSGDHTIAVSRYEQLGPVPTPAGAAGMFTATGDVTQPATLEWMETHFGQRGVMGTPLESLLYAVGYDRTSNANIHSVYAGGLQNVLAALPCPVTRAIYISTTGVYGTAGGEWVDEGTPTDPQREGGRASLAAERVLAEHPLGTRSAILRLAGIYGPGRVPYIDKLRAGEPLAVPSAGWLNLIHVDDAARIVVAVDRWLAARELSDGPHVFCVSDGTPVQRGEYYAKVARLIGAPPPAFTTPPPGSPAAARAGSDRRVSNAKLLREVGVTLEYPSYHQGLAAILQAPDF